MATRCHCGTQQQVFSIENCQYKFTKINKIKNTLLHHCTHKTQVISTSSKVTAITVTPLSVLPTLAALTLENTIEACDQYGSG